MGIPHTLLPPFRESVHPAQGPPLAGDAGERSHSEIQSWLRDLGHALGFDVCIAANDQSRIVDGTPLGTGCCRELPPHVTSADGIEAVRLIDVLWLDRDSGRVAGGFEVEQSTSIYSGIVRLFDLALGVPDESIGGLFLVAQVDREDEVRAQLERPAFTIWDSSRPTFYSASASSPPVPSTRFRLISQAVNATSVKTRFSPHFHHEVKRGKQIRLELYVDRFHDDERDPYDREQWNRDAAKISSRVLITEREIHGMQLAIHSLEADGLDEVDSGLCR